MARVSFRLRRVGSVSDTVGVGSFNRGTIADQNIAGANSVDEDAAIRSTGIITSIPVSAISTFEANAIGYNNVQLVWNLSEPVELLPEIPDLLTRLVGITIVYSKTGFPETVADGETIFNFVAETAKELDAFNETYIDPIGYIKNHSTSYEVITDQGTIVVPVPESGRWAYYSLFAYYNEGGAEGTYFYNKLASLEVLVPRDYGSIDLLWEKIPKYYRELDKSTKLNNLGNGQLYRYLNIFGFELDRMRTIIDALMVQYDPLLAESEAIDQLSQMLGLEVGVKDLGVSRIRSLLHDIGYLRSKKGTIDSILGYITAVGGSRVTYTTSTVAPYYKFYVDAQRSNLVANPKFLGKPTPNWTIMSQNAITVDGSSYEGLTITAGGSDTLVAIQSKVAVPADANTVYYASMDLSGDYVVYTPTWATAASWSSWTSASVAPPIAVDPLTPNRLAFNMSAPATTGLRYPVFVFKLLAGKSVTINKWMVEPNNYGSFFDGDTIFGGYLYQNYSTDYLWENPSAPRTGYSTYTANRKKTQDAIERLMPKILPVTLLGGTSPKYTVSFDWVPGKTP